jgi:hypothetical protein
VRKSPLTLLPCLLVSLALPVFAQEPTAEPVNSSSKAGGRPSPQITFLIQIVELNGIGLQVLSKAKLAKTTTAEPSAATYQDDNRLRELIFEQIRAGHGSVVVDTELFEADRTSRQKDTNLYQYRCFLCGGARTDIGAAIGYWQAKHLQYPDIPSKPDPCFRQPDQPRHQRAHPRQPHRADYLNYPKAG